MYHTLCLEVAQRLQVKDYSSKNSNKDSLSCIAATENDVEIGNEDADKDMHEQCSKGLN